MPTNLSFRFSLFGNYYYFTSKFTFLTLFLIAICVGLGYWQWNTATTATRTTLILNKEIAILPADVSDIASGKDLNYTPISLTGTFDYRHDIYLINRTYKKQPGILVITPFKPVDSDTYILINRGFTANTPMETSTATSSVKISGILFKPAYPIFLTADFDENHVTWPLSVNHMNLDKLSKALGYPLYPYEVLLDADNSYGFTRDWTSYITNLNPAQHKIYAEQWFILALLIAVIFIVFNTDRV